MGRDLTKGSIIRNLLLFSLPMMAGNLLQQLYNLTDTVMVGRFLGSEALAAVGSSYALMTFLTSLLTGLSMGSGALLSRDVGAADEDRFLQDFWYSISFIGLLTIFLTTFVYIVQDPILRALRIPEGVMPQMKEYVAVVFLGIPLVFLYNFSSYVLRSRGDSVTPLILLGFSSALNILLDYIFIVVFGRGIAGAAEATVIAQAFSGIGGALHVAATGKDLFRNLGKVKFEGKAFLSLVMNDVLTGLQQSVMNFGILMVQGLVNSFGTIVMAAFAASVKIDTFAYMPAQEFGNAYSIFISQNHGAGETERIRKGTVVAFAASISFCIVASAAIFFLSPILMGIFSNEASIIAAGTEYLRVEGLFYWGIGALFLFYGYFRAVEKPQVSLLLTVVSLGTRVALSYALAPNTPLGVLAIWWSIPVGWILADATGLWIMKRK